MGFFDKLFGKKKDSKQKLENKLKPEKKENSTEKKKSQNHFLTNSDDYGLGEIELGISGKERVDGILAIAAMEKIAKAKNEEFKFGVMHTSLLEEGALTVPVVCSIGETKYSFYFIYQEEEFLKYKDLVNHVTRTPYPNLIYFSSIPIYDGYQPKSIIEPFQLADLRYDSDSKAAGKYAMWWSSPSDPYFHKSKTYDSLAKLNEFMKGYETYMTGYVLRQTRIVKKMELQRMKLPENHVTYIIDAPEEKKILLDISQEKGIRFLFPIDSTTPEYRDRFVKGAMVDFVANIIPLKQKGFPADEEIEPNSHDWFTFMASVVKQKEEAGEMKDHQIGLIDFNTQMN